jgi:hypothetical protein
MTRQNHEIRELTASELDTVTGGDKATTGGTKTTTKTPPNEYLVYDMNEVFISSVHSG